MTTKEIQSKLIDHYSLAIERVKEAETFEGARSIARGMMVDHGVCYYSRRVLNYSIYDKEWVLRNRRGPYWGPLAIGCTDKKEILSRLQLRLDILKKEYSLSIETIKPSSV